MKIEKENLLSEEEIYESIKKYKQNKENNIFFVSGSKSKLKITDAPTSEEIVLFTKEKEGTVYSFCFI